MSYIKITAPVKHFNSTDSYIYVFFLEGLFGQHIAKKHKIMRSSLDISYDNAGPIGGSAPSPVASQISNPNRLIRYFGGRDRGGRKNKALKVLPFFSD